MQIIDITNPSSPKPVSVLDINFISSIITVKEGNKNYVIVTTKGDKTVQIFDITTPASPKLVKALKDGSGGFNSISSAVRTAIVKMGVKNYALVLTNGNGLDKGFQIIDITNPLSPKPEGSFSYTSGFLPNFSDITAVKIGNKTYALITVTIQGKIKIVDITNPASPKIVKTLTNGSTYKNIEYAYAITTIKAKGKVYSLSTSQVDSGKGIQIIDVTNPKSPKAVAAIDDGDTDSDGNKYTELGNPFGITTVKIGTKTYALVASRADKGIQIIDVTDPESPKAAKALSDGSKYTKLDGLYRVVTVVIGGNTYAIASSQKGLQIIQLNNTSPVFKIDSKTIDELESLSLTSATDADGDPLEFSIINTPPEGLSINKTSGKLTWTPTKSQSGTHT